MPGSNELEASNVCNTAADKDQMNNEMSASVKRTMDDQDSLEKVKSTVFTNHPSSTLTLVYREM